MDKKIEQLVVSFLEGELDEQGAQRLAGHLETHDEDREEFLDLASQARAMEVPFAPAKDLSGSVLNELYARKNGSRFVGKVLERLPRPHLRWRRAITLAAAALVLLAVGVGIWHSGPGPMPLVALAAPEIMLLGSSKEGIELEFAPPAAKADTLEAELYDLSGKILAKVTRVHSGEAVKVNMSAPIDPKDLAKYYLRYRTTAKTEFQRRSLYFLKEILETTVLFHRKLVAGTRPMIRVIVKDRAAGKAMAGAKVTLTLKDKDKTIANHEGVTNARGELSAAIPLPDRQIKGAQLTVLVKSRTAEDKIEEAVDIASATRTLLTSDKPLYQPGQTIHMRALSLRQPSMKPLAAVDAVFEVEDAKGNKVFKQVCQTDEFGISHADFVLADELNKGTYKIRAIVGGAKEEKTVTVDRYVLPKFKIAFKTDRKFYRPGETVKVDLQTDYFFGKPVAGGKVAVKCAKFDVKYTDFRMIEATTDKKGHYSFEVKLPDHFVGQPLQAGKASAKFDIKITDTGDHSEKITRNVTVSGSPIIIAAVPESGDLISGLANRIYIVTTYADSSPASCKVTWSDAPGGKAVEIKTDKGGFAEVTITPKAGTNVPMTLAAKDAKGNTGQAKINLKPKAQAGDDRVLLRTDRSLYKVGDRVTIVAMSTRKTGTLYVDVIKNRQTYLTRTLELKDGKAADKIALDANLAGTVQISAYLLGANGVMVRDRRLAIVDPANDLRIKIGSDSKTYLPGTEAKISFKVTDSGGKGVASALGVMVVDEAVFALQEMQPGLDKFYFYLEKEIAKPRYEIHGWEIDSCMPRPWMPGPGPMPLPMPRAEGARREKAARVLLASAKGAGKHSIHVNTYQRDNRAVAFQLKMQQKMQPALQKQYQKINQAMNKYSQAHRKDKNKRKTGIALAELVEEGLLKKEDVLDSWGGTLKIAGRWYVSHQRYYGFWLTSPGIDGKEGTADDFSYPVRYAVRDEWQMDGRIKGVAGRLRMMRELVVDDAIMGRADLERARRDKRKDGSGSHATGGTGGAAPPRIRQYFPETLFFNPAVITNSKGLATLTVPLADSITTWRMTCMASSGAGALGSTTSGIRVFQDFFVDVDFPVSLTQNDQVHVPVVVYNYLKTNQTVRLEVKKGDWYDLLGPAQQKLQLGPSEVKAVYFPIKATKIGFGKFTVFGYGAKKSDAVARSVEVVPDGKEHLFSSSGRLEKDVTCRIEIPTTAIDDASKIFVKVYPGMLAQMVEGLDKMLRMPFGCFEQTSSVTYPNILVMDYMKSTGKITPAIQMKAEGFINAGYQRLLSFEVKGGGFEWFGKAPAHRILTAFGLMEFDDMSKVHEVDPAVIQRTQAWLAKCQDKDGSYKPSKGGIREGAINKFTDDVHRNTAYITWALASTGYQGPQIDKGFAYLRKGLDDIKDNYTLALTANAFASVEPRGKTTLAVLEALFARRTEEDDLVYWKANSQTPTHGRGSCADIEVTGLAVQAFVRCGRQLGAIGKAVSYLAKKKDAYGTWQSTQATIQALRAMLMAERGAAQTAEATIGVAINGKNVKSIRIDKSNSDVLQLVDLKELTRKGDNSVALSFEGTGGLMYQVVGRYYLPHPKQVKIDRAQPLSIKVDYDRTALATEDILAVTATASWNRPGKAKMIIVDLGLPPGFTLLPDNLNSMVNRNQIEKYSVTGRQIIVYLRELEQGKPIKISYSLLAKYPLKAKTAKSVVYEYYNPKSRAEAAPIQLTVVKKGVAKG